MKCKSIQQKLTLYLSDDLGQKLKDRVKKHLDRCPGCWQELQSLRNALLKIKQADLESLQHLALWDEERWSDLMKQISALEAPVQSQTGGAFIIWKRRASRLAVAAGIIGLTVLAGVLIRENRLYSPPEQLLRKKPATAPETQPAKIEMAFVLPESGVQVIWILHRNFNLQGDKR